MKVKSFGCSFVYGNELSDDAGAYVKRPSKLTWAALIAKKLDADYECYATPGAGNLQILEKIISNARSESDNCLYLISWTWIDRFDYLTHDAADKWDDQWKTICPLTVDSVSKDYYRNIHSEPRDKLSTLNCIMTAIHILQSKGIPFFMLYQDSLMLDTVWHAPDSIKILQESVRPHLFDFSGLTFIQWSKLNNFPFGKYNHPLDLAHSTAADLIFNEAIGKLVK